MHKGNVIGFYKPEDENGYLSNWYTVEFEYAGRLYNSTEQFMMAQKAIIFHDYVNHRKILQTNDLDQIKALGRKVHPYDDAIWAAIRMPILRCGIRAKFQQNPELLNKLLSTGNKILAECSPRDKTWGIGLGVTNRKIQNPLEWAGQNLLGTVLMQVRDDLRLWSAVSKNNLSYIDAKDLPPIDIWNMNVSEVRLLPNFKDTLDVYAKVVSFRDKDIDFYTRADCSLYDIELAMRTNMGGGLPAAWFWELKQSIYDIVRYTQL